MIGVPGSLHPPWARYQSSTCATVDTLTGHTKGLNQGRKVIKGNFMNTRMIRGRHTEFQEYLVVREQYWCFKEVSRSKAVD